MTLQTGLSMEVLDLGTNPMWLEAVKTYDTEEDELIFEGPLAWASTMKVSSARATRH